MTLRKSIADFQKFSSKIFPFDSRENRRLEFLLTWGNQWFPEISKQNLMWHSNSAETVIQVDRCIIKNQDNIFV